MSIKLFPIRTTILGMKRLILCSCLTFFFSQGRAENLNQQIITRVDSVQQCIHPNETIVVPVTTENFWDVSSISLALNIDPSLLTFTSVQNIHPQLQTSNLFANQVGSMVMISWINPFGEADIGSGTMFELVFDAVPGQCQLSWDTITQGFCEYMNLQQNILAALFLDGNFEAWPIPVADAGPDKSIFLNECTTLTETGCGAGCTYQWNEGSSTASINVCPTDTTTYSVTVTNANGCTGSDEVTVYVIVKILTKADSVQQCVGNPQAVIVPITTENSWSVSGISLALIINTSVLSYTSIQNIHPELQSGALLANQLGSSVFISWISPFAPANIGSGTMFELVFNAVPGQCPLVWDVISQGFCEYTDINQNILPAEFIDGNYYGLPKPIADAGQDEDICEGDCITLTATGGVSYLWSNGTTTSDNTVCPNDSTLYIVTVTAANSCSETDTVNVNVNPIPLTYAGPDTTIYLNSCIDLIATGAGTGGTYLWNTGATDATINVCPFSTTIYSVTATNIYGCDAIDDVEITVIPGPNISGYVNYVNVMSTPMNNTEVRLIRNNNIIQTTTTDANGFYQFISLYDSAFLIDGASTKLWGGGNSNDALLIMRHFVGLSLLSGLPLEAADVNDDDIVNTLDASYVAQRFVGMVQGFPSGDWVFEKNTIVLNGQNEINDFGALCFGDVNASYVPPSLKIEPNIQLNIKGIKDISSFNDIDIPVFVDQDINIGAISIVFEYPDEIFEVTDVKLNAPNTETFIYNADEGELKIAYYNPEKFSLAKNDLLFLLSFKIKDMKRLPFKSITISVKANSELADEYGNVLSNIKLSAPEILLNRNEFVLGYNYPNPFFSETEIDYSLAEQGIVNLCVFNPMGEKIAVILNNESKDAGSYKVRFDGSGLASGIYFVKLEGQCRGKIFIDTRPIIKK